jgi:hypothetical protein
MKVELVAVMAAIVMSVNPVFGQSKLQVAEVQQVLTNPDQYRGKVVALHGIVEKVSFEQKTFTIVDSRTGANSRGTNVESLAATMQGGSQIAIPQAGQEAIVLGQVENKDGVAKLTATQVFTNKADVQQILTQGSIARKPGKRPGDNLGRDAQPSE